MKKMTRLLLINWHYFHNTIIDFGTINFLTGKNSSGKSTIIDALQVVLMGETRSSAFNRAASKKSERTLKSYLIGSMGEDMDNGKKSLREGKTFSTYIVAEFYDDYKADYFCLGAVFDSFSDGGDFRKRFFWLRNRLPENRFIEDSKTMNIQRMTQYFKEKYPNKFETRDTSEAYRQIVLSRLNVQDAKFVTMLKKAISFEPINDIEKFITENVCDIEDDIDITAMQENIRYYKDQEAMAERFEGKLNKLADICEVYSEVEKLRSRKKIQQFLIDYGTYNDSLEKLDRARSDLEKYNEDIIKFRQKYSELERYIEQLNAENMQMIRDKEKYRLDNDIGRLEEDEERYKNDIAEYERKISGFILNVKASSTKWLDRLSKCMEVIDDEEIISSIEQVKAYLCRTERFTEADFELLSSEYFSLIRECYISVKEKLTPILAELSSEVQGLNRQKDELCKDIADLKNGIKSYPEKAEILKRAIRDGLKQKYNKDIPVDYFADLIEITDSEWQDAIEGYLNTRRMNIIVLPEYFMDAYAIYKKVRKNENIYGCAVADLEKVYNADYKVLKGSLAEIVNAEDKYVGAYVRFLLGNAMRCYSDDKIREHKISVTKDCMVYKGYSVSAINKEIYRVPYIGREAVAKQIEEKTRQADEITATLNVKSKIADAVKAVVHGEWFVTEDYVALAVVSAFNNYSSRNQAAQKLAETEEMLDKIDMLWLEDMEKKIEAKQTEINASHKEKENTSNKISSSEKARDDIASNVIPMLERDITEKENKLESYSAEYQQETGIPRYEAELTEFGNPSAVARKFESPIKGTETELKKTENLLADKRSEYNSEEHTSFSVTAADNCEYEEEHNKIKNYELPQYRGKIERAKNEAMEQFKSDFLYKLRDNIKNVEQKIAELNDALKLAQFGNDTYKFKVAPNPAYLEYYNMIMSPMLEFGNEGLFSFEFTDTFQTVIDSLFAQIIAVDASGNSIKNVEMFSKYKTYLSFDLLATDSTGKTEMLSRSINTKSGGETQTPFYIAVLASFAQLYKINDSSEYGNTARIVIFDEAFNKMDGERIIESVKLLHKFGLQAIICSPPEKAADIAPVSDKTLLVHKEAIGSVYKSTVIEWTKEMSEM